MNKIQTDEQTYEKDQYNENSNLVTVCNMIAICGVQNKVAD